MLDKAFKLRSTLSEAEEIALYFTSGYVAFKENICSDDTESSSYVANDHPFSEFTTLLSRGRYPPPELFELCCVLFCYYKNIQKSCINHLLHAFK